MDTETECMGPTYILENQVQKADSIRFNIFIFVFYFPLYYG